MGNRLFVVKEVLYSEDSISEDELKKRIDRILMLPRPNRWLSMDVDIDILLHGEADKGQPATAHCPNCGRALSRCKCEAIKQAVEGKE